MTNDERNQLIMKKIEEGMSLSDLQTLLAKEYHLPMTYFELRMLADDLRVNWTKLDKPKKKTASGEASPQTAGIPENSPDEAFMGEDADTVPEDIAAENAELPETAAEKENGGENTPDGNGSTAISFHDTPLPGTAMSGEVTFASGIRACWFMDRMGRLGLDAPEGAPEGSAMPEPTDKDLENFQTELQNAMGKRREELMHKALDGRTKVEISPIVKAGCQMNGTVEFASGAKGEWMLSQDGLGFELDEDSAQPTPEDKTYFQIVLQKVLREKGM